jgi:hypothetical protein
MENHADSGKRRGILFGEQLIEFSISLGIDVRSPWTGLKFERDRKAKAHRFDT